jgi:hypothetical protein
MSDRKLEVRLTAVELSRLERILLAVNNALAKERAR